MLKTIIRRKKKKPLKLERLQRFVCLFVVVVVVYLFIYFLSFKPERLTQNPKAELKSLWVGLDSRTK